MSDDDASALKNDIVDDSKQTYRFKQIEEEGNDPAKSFQKVNPEGESSGGGGGGTETGGAEAGGEAGAPTLKEKAKPDSDYVRPSQKGLKKASDYPFGEDVTGRLENNRSIKSDMSITPKFAGGSVFSLESISKGLVPKLDNYLKSLKQEKQELLSENNNKSMMDETNILE
jgi:hypothetical protein